MLTSVCALGVSIVSVREMCRYYRLSVAPNLYLEYETSEIEGQPNGIYILNRGLGPARINNFRFKVDGIIVPSDLEGGWPNLYKSMRWTKLDASIRAVTPGQMIAAKTSEYLIEFDCTKITTVQAYKKIHEMRDRVAFRIEYESIYKEKFVYDSEDPQWFSDVDDGVK